MIEVKKASKCRRCNCCMSVNDVKEVSFWSEWNGTTVALCRECREEACRALADPPKEQEDVMKLFDSSRRAQNEFCAEYDRYPETIYMTPGLYAKLKAEGEKKGFVEPPFPHFTRFYGAIVKLIDAPGDLAFFGTLAVGKPIIE